MKIIFLLPNRPLLPNGASHYHQVEPKILIELNGNHWRKILTIIAKLSAFPEEDWRIVRDTTIWRRAELAFDVSSLNLKSIDDAGDWLFVVGKTFDNELPIPCNSLTLGQCHIAKVSGTRIWSPYLDYRQFPNVLIDDIVQHMREHTVLC